MPSFLGVIFELGSLFRIFADIHMYIYISRNTICAYSLDFLTRNKKTFFLYMKIFFPFILEIFENEISLYMWNFIQQQIISKRNDCFLSAHISFLFMTLFRCIRRRDLNTERNFFCSINHVFMIFCFFWGFLIRLFSCAKQKLLILRIFDSLMEFMGRFKWIFNANNSKSGWEN